MTNTEIKKIESLKEDLELFHGNILSIGRILYEGLSDDNNVYTINFNSLHANTVIVQEYSNGLDKLIQEHEAILDENPELDELVIKITKMINLITESLIEASKLENELIDINYKLLGINKLKLDRK